MLRTHVLPWLAALGLMLFGAQQSFAQHGHSHGHASPGHASPGHATVHAGGAHYAGGGVHHVASPAWHGHGGYYHNGYYHNGYHHHGSFTSWGFYPRYYGYWPGYYRNWYGGYGYPGYSSYYASTPAYPYYDYSYYPNYDYSYYATPYYNSNSSYYPMPSTTVTEPPAPAAATGAAAHIEVIVPNPDAAVWFNGHQTTTGGTVREFDTPALVPGTTYTYSVRAVWPEDGRMASSERVVDVTAGAQVVVDFTRK